MTCGSPIITFDDVSFSYPGADPILTGTSFSITSGEIVALMGLNGSGKSTITKLIEGFLIPTNGTIEVLGLDPSDERSLRSIRPKIGFILQNPDDQLVATTVLDEVAFGPENLGVPREEILEKVCCALDAVQLQGFEARDVNTLSGGQKQRVAIAGALAMEPTMLIMDEATSMLDERTTQQIWQILEQLRTKGVTILVITHSPTEAAYADRILNVEGGRVHPLDLKELEALKAAYEQDMAQIAHIGAQGMTQVDVRFHQSGPQDEPIIRFDDVSYAYATGERPQGKGALGGLDGGAEHQSHEAPLILSGLDLNIARGESVAIMGPNGSGKSTLVQHMNGLLTPTSGTVTIDGVSTATKEGANQARSKVGIAFQFPERSLFAPTVLEDVAFGPRNLGYSDEAAEQAAQKALQSIGLGEELWARSPYTLSGGQQRRAALAGVLAMKPEVLVLDEPCANLDLPSRKELLGLIKSLQEDGMTIVMVTHDALEAGLLAERIYPMPDRRPAHTEGSS